MCPNQQNRLSVCDFLHVFHFHPVGATEEKPIPSLSSDNMDIMLQSKRDFKLKDSGMNRN